MFRELFQPAERGATVLTGSNRLARSLVASFNEYQRDCGRSVWTTPKILPWEAWLRQCWRTRLIETPSAPLLLNAAQESAVWEAIVEESPEGRSLLRLPETAEAAKSAWDLIHAYRLPFDAAAFSVTAECEAFHGWAVEFASRCERNGWIDSARLPGAIASLVRDGALDRPFPLLLAGFDELTPRQRDVLDALCGSDPWGPRGFPANSAAQAAHDTKDEIDLAARWAAGRLEANPSARIGVIDPGIESDRARLDRAFAEALGSREAFHLSLGAPLGDRGMIRTALSILELAASPIDPDGLSVLLRSPYWKGGEAERSQRAMLDAELRRSGYANLGVADLRALAGACPDLRRILAALDREIRKLTAEQAPSAWSHACSRLLKAAGWPGDRALSSEEHQAIEAWNNALSDFSTLDAASPRMPFSGALSRLRRYARSTPFQPENRGAAVEVMGLLEASGLQFDHLWVMGLHDGVMPPPARPNPFLPAALQRKYGLPHSSAERELEFNTRLIARLAESAPETVFSYPLWEADQPLSPSPLLAAFKDQVRIAKRCSWRRTIAASSNWESFSDPQAPALPDDSCQRGGAGLLRDMSQCPFRAFAKHRLGAYELDDPIVGIGARERGSAIHKALELFWDEMGSQQALRAATEDSLAAALDRAIEQALAPLERLGRTLERKRLQGLLREWIEIEKRRPPFTILAHERKGQVTVGGLTLSLRVDRLDELPDGARAIIDYKTGIVSKSAWSGDRPDEPQVPLYCATSEHRVSAAAFAQLRSGALELIGIANGEIGPMIPMQCGKNAGLAELIPEWRVTLHRLGEAFRLGHAAVDPKPGACDYCAIGPLCRVGSPNQ